MALLIAATGAIACSDASGLYIHVQADPSAKEAELFFGNDDVSGAPECGGSGCAIRPMGATATSYGSGWTSDADDAVRVPLRDGKATFRIAPQPDHPGMDALLIVAYPSPDPTDTTIAGDAILRDVKVDDAAHEVTVRLGGDAGQVWRRPDDDDATQSACALVQHADGTNEFFVPGDDSDCDGAANGTSGGECRNDDFTWCGLQPPGLSAADSVLSDPTTTSCRFAGMPCVDMGCAQSTTETHVPTSPIGCLPLDVCHNLGAASCTDFPGCFTSANLGFVPHVSCTIDYTSGGTPCPAALYVSSNGTAGTTSYGYVLGNNACTGIKLTPIDQSIRLDDKAMDTDGPEIDLDTPAQLPNPGLCDRDVVPHDPVNTTSIPSPTLLLLDLQVGPALQPQHRFIPLLASFVALSQNQCPTTPTPCTLDAAGTSMPYVCP